MISSDKFFNSRQWDSETNRVEYQSEFIDLVRSIESAAESAGLILSRWQANKGGHRTTVTYALHTGERAEQFRYMDDANVVDSITLNAAEGSTRRCAAYRALGRMATRAGII